MLVEALLSKSCFERYRSKIFFCCRIITYGFDFDGDHYFSFQIRRETRPLLQSRRRHHLFLSQFLIWNGCYPAIAPFFIDLSYCALQSPHLRYWRPEILLLLLSDHTLRFRDICVFLGITHPLQDLLNCQFWVTIYLLGLFHGVLNPFLVLGFHIFKCRFVFVCCQCHQIYLFVSNARSAYWAI